MSSDIDLNKALQQRIIDTADEYHYIAEDQWSQVVDLKPEVEEDELEFRRLVRAALQFYSRAYLALLLVETDPEQQLEDLLEIVLENEPELAGLMQTNQAFEVLDEDGTSHLSHLFSVAEALRSVLLERSNALASTLEKRFTRINE